MQAVIACGGLGTRMREHGTDKVPKSLLPVNGLPFLGYLLRRLRDDGFTSIVLLVGHMAEQIEAFCAQLDCGGLEIKLYRDSAPGVGLESALRDVAQIPGALHNEFLLTYGDAYLTYDYGEVMRDEALGESFAVMAVQRVKRANVCVQLGIVLNHRPMSSVHFDYGAIAMTRAHAVRGLHALIVSDSVRAHEVDEEYPAYEIGSPEGYAEFQRYMAGGDEP